MNTNQQFADTGTQDAMPRGGMLSFAQGSMPGGDMNAPPATFATGDTRGMHAPGDMPAGSMLPTELQQMPSGAMVSGQEQVMPAAPAQSGGEGSADGMPIRGMLDTGSGGMPVGAMLSPSAGGESWNMDLAAPEQGCGC